MADTAARLAHLTQRTQALTEAVQAYQRALLDARLDGASWPELAKAAQCGIGAIRSRFSAAQNGGELHIIVQGVNAPQIPAPRRED